MSLGTGPQPTDGGPGLPKGGLGEEEEEEEEDIQTNKYLIDV